MNTLTLVLPCYNPPTGWKEIVKKNYDIICKELQQKVALIIVDDGSHLINYQDVKTLKNNIDALKWIQLPQNKGKGYAVRTGVEASDTDYTIYTDIDFPYLPQNIIAVFKTLQQGVDVAVGIKNKDYYKKIPHYRKWISKSLRQMIKTFMKLKITDTQCGLKGFNTKGKAIFLNTKINRYLFDLEFIYLCSQVNELSLKTITLTLRDDVVFRKMDLGIIKSEIISFIKILFR